jgi:hypothetical protein
LIYLSLEQTAYLYTKFSQGALNFYEYGSTSDKLAEHKADSTALQLAIWKLEGEIGSGLAASATAWAAYNSTSHIRVESRAWVAEADAKVADHTWAEIGNVRALNLHTDSGYARVSQDQLYPQPVAEPETYAMILVGLGLMGFVVRRRAQKEAMA